MMIVNVGGLSRAAGLFALAAGWAGAANAGPANLIANGNFSSNSTLSVEAAESAAYDASHGPNNWAGQQAGTNAGASAVTGWSFGSASSFDYVIDLQTYNTDSYNPAPANTNGTVGWWDQADGHFSTFNANPGALGQDKFAIASDPAYNNAAIQQLVSGLSVGGVYQLTFEQAATQQYGYDGAYTGAWKVSFGAQTLTGTAMTKAVGSYSPWSLVTLDFEATSTSELLSFLSTANVNSNPPFLLLDDVSLANVPEPGTVSLSVLALGGLLIVRHRRKAQHSTASKQAR